LLSSSSVKKDSSKSFKPSPIQKSEFDPESAIHESVGIVGFVDAKKLKPIKKTDSDSPVIVKEKKNQVSKKQLEIEQNLTAKIETELKLQFESEYKTKLENEIEALHEAELNLKTELEQELTDKIETELIFQFESEYKTKLENEIETLREAELSLKSELEQELTDKIETELIFQFESEYKTKLENEIEALHEAEFKSKSQIELELKPIIEAELRLILETEYKLKLEAEQKLKLKPELEFEPENLIEVDMDTKQIVEAILFAADKPMTTKQVQKVYPELERPELQEIQVTIDSIIKDYEARPVGLKRLANGYRFQVKEGFSYWVSRLFEEKPPKYSRALLETIAIIAYRQPVTRGDIEDIRGVGVSSNIIRTLVEREWVRVIAHKEVPGRPALYGTTKQFLDYFNLSSLEQLPTLEEIKDLDFSLTDPVDEQQNKTKQSHSEADVSEKPLTEVQTSEEQKIIEPISETRH
jgi:segregation and condensation protein B